jgi:small subunit ribosomal protein S16
MLFEKHQDFGGDGPTLGAGPLAESFIEVIGDVFDVKRSHRDILGIAYGNARRLSSKLSVSLPGIVLQRRPSGIGALRYCRGARPQARMDGFRRTDLVLTIRLARIGKKKKPFYRVVVIERTRPRDGRVKEAVGTYDPLKKPAEIKLDAERIKYWLGQGAQPSDTVRSFLKGQKIAVTPS